jgi:hypothetical protein
LLNIGANYKISFINVMVTHYKRELWALIEDRAKSKVSTWRPSWILGGAGFQNEPYSLCWCLW